MREMARDDHLEEPEDPLLRRLGAGWQRWTYEAVMIGLAIAVVVLLPRPDVGAVRVANLTIWAIFVVDYAVRFRLAEDRRRFVRTNIPDLVAILPLDFFRAARVARLARLARLVRAGAVLWRATADLRAILRTNGLHWVLTIAAATIGVGGLLVWMVDPTVESVGDGFWWAIVTSTTVGYGDLSPVTPLARTIAVVIMIIGVGTIGMLTGSIATYFTGERAATEPSPSPQVEFIRERLDHWHELASDDRREVAAMLTALAQEAEEHPARP